jgi:hypothetical protein
MYPYWNLKKKKNIYFFIMCYFGCLVCQKRTHLLFNDVSLELFDEGKKMPFLGVPLGLFDKPK